MRNVIALLLLLSAAPAYAQIENCPSFKKEIDALVSGQTDGLDHAANLLAVGLNIRCFAVYGIGLDRLNQPTFGDFVKKLESSRSDKQSGGGSTSAGTTSVVSQGPAAKVISVAAEYGAATQTVQGQVITLTGNLAGVPSALVKHDIFPYCEATDPGNSFCVAGSMLSLLRRVTIGVSFDASRDTQVAATPSTGGTPAAQPVTFTASKSEIAAVTARVELWNRRDVASKAFADEWRSKSGPALDQTGKALIADVSTYTDKMRTAIGAGTPWLTKHLAAVRAAGRDRAAIVKALNEALKESVAETNKAIPDLEDRVDALVASYSKFQLARDELVDSLASKNVIAFEYANNRPTGQPTTTSLKLIADLPLTPQTKFVLNGGVTLYDDPAAIAATGATRYRDAQVAAQLDQALGNTSITGPLVFSLAAYYQYQNSPAVVTVDPLNPVPGVSFVGLPAGAQTVFATVGTIVLGQAKLTFAPPGSNIKIPASITYSNRTELIDRPTWRGQVGITYDFDSLFAALK